ncbi:MAG: hypothetical protein NC081_08370 [Roseburia sp.]|nr:hypothetical protein [Roseburia sp.]
MKKMIQKKVMVVAGMTVLLLLTGCQSKSDSAETEALKNQISQLEQQVAQLQQQSATENQDTISSQESMVVEDNIDREQTSAADNGIQGTSNQATTYTMEELTSMVDAYLEKANAATPNGSSEDMETFFSLKQEEKQIDDLLDIHEDELERLYRQNALSKDEYKSLEWELEKLEDSLDDVEDRLEDILVGAVCGLCQCKVGQLLDDAG